MVSLWFQKTLHKNKFHTKHTADGKNRGGVRLFTAQLHLDAQERSALVWELREKKHRPDRPSVSGNWISENIVSANVLATNLIGELFIVNNLSKQHGHFFIK